MSCSVELKKVFLPQLTGRVSLFSLQLVGFRLIHRMVTNYNNVQFLEVLHELNCDMNACTLNFKDTPILIAITQNQIETVNFLVQHGADVNRGERSMNRIEPLFLAMQLNLKKVIQVLLSSKSIDVNAWCTMMNGKEPLLSRCILIAPAYAELLLEAGADPNIVDDQNATPLTWCAHFRNVELIKLLIRYGADVNKGESVPLLIAVRKGKYVLFCKKN